MIEDPRDPEEFDEKLHAASIARAKAAINAICPHIVDNPFVPHLPLPAQAVALGEHMETFREQPDELFELLYGGAAGGGKSDWLLMAAAQYTHVPDFNGVLIRRTYKQLSQPGALMDRAMKWWNKNNGVHWNGSDKMFTFPSGARVKMAYHGTPADDENFQGAEYQFAGYDELTHWPDPSAYEWISLSRLRREAGSPIPLRSLATANPGGKGHLWVKARFVGSHDLVSGEYIPAPCRYLPARIIDNPYLDRKAYIKSLMKLHPTVRKQLLDGDWSAREPGDYFRVEWFGPLLDPITHGWDSADKLSVRWWDLAASEREDACNTAGVLMSRHRNGVRAIEHCNSFKATPGKRDDKIVSQAVLDGREVIVGLEIEPGSGGITQYLAIEKRLRSQGYRVVGARPKAMTKAEELTMVRAPSSENGKLSRCDPVSSCLERGWQRRGEGEDTMGEWWGLDVGRAPHEGRDGIRMFVGPWTQALVDVLEGVGEKDNRMDEADAISGAWSYLEAHPFGQRLARRVIEEATAAEIQNLHPSARPDPIQVGRDRAGHWTP